MAKRPASRGASRRPAKSKQGMSPLALIVIGVLIGLFLGFLFYLAALQKNAPADDVVAQATSSQKQTGKKAETKKESNLPKFDFYAVLPQMEVVLPRSEEPQAKPAASKPAQISKTPQTPKVEVVEPKPKAEAQGVFLLQAGSFRDKSSAEQLRAEFILQGFDASVQPGILASGDTWYRVMIGPYTSESSMRQAQNRLSSLKVETLAIQVKGT